MYRARGNDGALGDQFANLARLGDAAAADSARVHYVAALRDARQTGLRAFESRTLESMAGLYQRHGDAGRAMAYFDSAAAVRASYGETVAEDENRLALVARDDKLHASWLALALSSDTSEAGALAGLAIAERGRTQALLALMRKSAESVGSQLRAAQGLGSAGANLRAEGEALRASARSLGPTLSYAFAGDTLVTWFLDGAGAVRLWRTPVRPDSVGRLVSALRGPITRATATANAREISRRADGDTTRAGVARGIDDGTIADTAALRLLGALILPADVRAALPRSGALLVIPQGVLGLVPFAAFPLDKDVWLADRYALRYAPSFAAAREFAGARADRSDMAWRHRALVVGNPVMPTNIPGFVQPIKFGPLLAAETEARTVAAEFGVRPLTGAEATERAVVARLPEAGVVHLATHGYAFSSPESPAAHSSRCHRRRATTACSPCAS